MAAPLGWQCRERMIKQAPWKPTQKKSTKYDGHEDPGPGYYEDMPIFCGKGYSNIKQEPAYTFRKMFPILNKPAATPRAIMCDIRNKTRIGTVKIHQGIIAEKTKELSKAATPGPGQYSPKNRSYIKRAPAYTMRIAAKPPYQPWDQWTAPPNMYCPPIPGKRSPAFSQRGPYKDLPIPATPGPTRYDLKYDMVEKAAAAPTFGYALPIKRDNGIPAPNAYCHKKFMYPKPSATAPSFGILHSPYLGSMKIYEMPSELEKLARDLA